MNRTITTDRVMVLLRERTSGSVDLLFELAEVLDQAGTAARLAGDAGIAAVENKPVVAVHLKLGGNHLQQLLFNLLDVLTGGKLCPVANAENMRIDRNRRPAEGGIEYHVGGFAPDAGQRFQRGSVLWDFAIMLLQQDPAGLNDVFRFAVKQADGFDIRLDPSTPRLSIAAGVLATG